MSHSRSTISNPNSDLNSSSTSSQSSNSAHHSADSKTLLLVTAVPFWQQQTGAHQRILSLVQALTEQRWPVTCIYIGSLQPEGRDSTPHPDRESIRRLKLEVRSLIDDWRPQSGIESIRWQLRCLAHALAGKLWPQRSIAQRSAQTSTQHAPISRSRRLADFEDAELKRRFSQWVRNLRPDEVIVEYLTLSYLLPPKQHRAGVRYWVDTHDLLSSRCVQFQQQGLSHWIEISPAEEAEALKQFDGIIAIEETEADQFRSMTEGQVPVVVAGFAAMESAILASPASANTPQSESTSCLVNELAEVSIGMIASDNAINLAGLQWFLDEVWPRLNSETKAGDSKPSIKLVLAGSISKHPGVAGLKAENLTCLGLVDDLREFYDKIQIAINPIQFGTGLKIKSIEALSFGKPLIAHRHSIKGLPAGPESPFVPVDSSQEMVQQICRLVQHPELLVAKSSAAREYAKRFLSTKAVYGKLIECLRQADSR